MIRQRDFDQYHRRILKEIAASKQGLTWTQIKNRTKFHDDTVTNRVRQLKDQGYLQYFHDGKRSRYVATEANYRAFLARGVSDYLISQNTATLDWSGSSENILGDIIFSCEDKSFVETLDDKLAFNSKFWEGLSEIVDWLFHLHYNHTIFEVASVESLRNIWCYLDLEYKLYCYLETKCEEVPLPETPFDVEPPNTSQIGNSGDLKERTRLGKDLLSFDLRNEHAYKLAYRLLPGEERPNLAYPEEIDKFSPEHTLIQAARHGFEKPFFVGSLDNINKERYDVVKLFEMREELANNSDLFVQFQENYLELPELTLAYASSKLTRRIRPKLWRAESVRNPYEPVKA